jgi:hypothetical protein
VAHAVHGPRPGARRPRGADRSPSRGTADLDRRRPPNRGTDKEGAFSGTWTGPQVVLTRQKPEGLPAEPGVTYSDDVLEAIDLAKAGAGDSEYVSILGAGAARSCWEAGALDEVLVSIAPIMLGDGVRLFDLPGGGHVRLERLSASHGPVGTTLWFRVLPD